MIKKNSLIVKKIFTIFLSFFLSLLSLEIFTRLIIDNGMHYEIEMMKYANNLKKVSKYKEIGIEHKKNISVKLMGANINLNSDGFRNNYDIDDNKKKILMLGDSMTFGWGSQITFSDFLETNLNDYQIINAGIGNTNTIMQINNFFINFKDKYHYDLIILNFFINDFEDIKIKKPNFLEKNSFFYTFILSSINKTSTKFNIKNNWSSFYKETFLNEEIKKLTFNQILKLKIFCEQKNIKFLIHNIPELHDLKNYQFENETNMIKKFSVDNNILFYDSINSLKKYDEKNLWVTKNDAHANNKAHNIIGQGLLPLIKKILNN